MKFTHFGHTQNWPKNDASWNVDGFNIVRNGDRIQASGDMLFFHNYSKIIKIALDAHNLEIFLGIYFSNHTNKRAGTPWTNLKCRADRLWTNHHDCKEKQTILRFVAKKLSLNREILNEYASIHGGLCREPGPGKHHSPGAGILINLKIWLSTCVKSYV